jgi:tRNA pseudouridine55 synthase
MAVFNIYKPVGATPLEMIERLRQVRPKLAGVKMTYAGRLDPLAEGVLIILSGPDRFHKPKYLNLDKEYRADICFGITTDTFDVMGVIEDVSDPPDILSDKKVFKQFVGRNMFPYPPFSSYKVEGKPLFVWAKAGRLHEIKIPLKEMVINRIRVIDKKKLPLSDIAQSAIERINLVDGDFRQGRIKALWRKTASKKSLRLPVYTILIQCESGTYIRRLAHEAGVRVGSGACLYRLTRTAVGDFHSKDSIQV